MDAFSRAILSSAIFQRQDLAGVLIVLYAAVERFGAPQKLITDNGAVFRAKQLLAICEALEIEKEYIHPRQSWENLVETHFNVMRCMSQVHFEQVTSWEGAKAAHERFVTDYNAQPHWAHRKRDDNRFSPAEVLGWVTNKLRTPEQLHRIFYATRFLRRLSRLGYVHFRRWKLYGEEALARQPAVVWLHGDALTVEYEETPLSQYTVRYQPDHKHFKDVPEARRFETPYRSPQGQLWELDETMWRLAKRLPDYAPRRQRRKQTRYIQPPLLTSRKVCKQNVEALSCICQRLSVSLAARICKASLARFGIDYSHSNLSAEAQRLLLCLAPFTSVIWQDVLDDYTASLRQQPALATLPFERWPEVIREARNWGLLSPDPALSPFLRLQPILPYFLRNRLTTAEQTVRSAVEDAFRQHYDQLSDMLYQLLESKEPQERLAGQVITELEYENLLTALQLALTAQVSILHPYRALSSYLDRTQDQRRGLDLGQMVLSCLETYSPDKLADRVGAEFVGVIDDIANRQRLLKRYTEAEASYQKALALHLRIRSFDEETSKKLSAGIYHQLGMVAQEQRQWAQAEQYYQQALQIKIEFKDRYEQARTYHQLGRVAEEQRQWPQARDYFLIALETFVAYNDTYSGTVVLRSLVRLWQVSGDGGLPASIATVLGVSPGEVETALRELLGNEGGG